MYAQQQVAYAPGGAWPANYQGLQPGFQGNVQFVSPQGGYPMVAQPMNKALTWVNWCNIFAYVVNIIVTYSSQMEYFGPSNGDLSAKYQTLVTPASWTFSIWGAIFLYEAIFVVSQALPQYRNHAVTLAVSPWWWAACLFQSFWTIAFAKENIGLAFLIMLAILVSLVGAIVSGDMQSFPGAVDRWLLVAPFSLHGGWIMCASLVSLNVVFDSNHATPDTLLAVAVVSFVIACFLNTFWSMVFRGPDQGMVICLVSSWAFAGIASELANHMRLDAVGRFNPYTWSPEVTGGLHNAAQWNSSFAFCLAVVAAFMWLRKRAN